MGSSASSDLCRSSETAPRSTTLSGCSGRLPFSGPLAGRGIHLGAHVDCLWNSWARRLNARESHLRFAPSLLRWILMAAWVVLAANNIWQVPSQVGPDIFAHYQYVVYISRSWSLPLATDGWEMFQPPLFYSIAAPFYGLFSARLSADDIAEDLAIPSAALRRGPDRDRLRTARGFPQPQRSADARHDNRRADADQRFAARRCLETSRWPAA